MSDYNGGPAFPREDYQADNAPGQSGMTLRDYFAAKAMQSMLVCNGESGWNDCLIRDAYACADAMLIERVEK